MSERRAHGAMIMAVRDVRLSLRSNNLGDKVGALDGLLRAQRWYTLAELRQPPKKKEGNYFARINRVHLAIMRARNAIVAGTKDR